MKLVLIFVFTFLNLNLDIFAVNVFPCEDGWEQFKDEFCYQLFDGLQSYQNAAKVCHNNNSTLVSIHYAEEQEFLSNYIFNKKMAVDNVWIGAKFAEDNFYRWEDKTTLDDKSFSNWVPGNPKNLTDHCIEVLAVEGFEGQWADENCAKKNLPLCQRAQIPSISHISETVFALKHNLNEVKSELAKLKDETVPIGFIYVQLPKNSPPSKLWPSMSWTDVSSKYAGFFFRVVGGDAATFGQVQAYNAPRLEKVQNIVTSDHDSQTSNYASVPQTGWSGKIFTGSYNGANIFTQFKNSDVAEVRPVNMAIKVFQRTG